MDNTNRIAGPVAIAVVLAGSGLSYAHLQLESACWTLSVVAESLWRLLAANLAPAGISFWTCLGAGSIAALFLLVPAEERSVKFEASRSRSRDRGANHE
jgi:hypothetical protein